LETLAEKCGGWGFDGLELACWGDHFDAAEALRDPGYCAGRRALLERHGLGCWTIGNHLVGQAVCDPIDRATGACCLRRCGVTAIRKGVRGRRRSG
jgi:sugar phosphate isomerase/epimerase